MTSGGGDYFNFRSTSSSRRVTPIPAYIYGPVMLTGGIMVYCYYSCLNEAPLTKRKRLIATSPEMERKMGDDQYRALLKQFHGSILPSDHRASITVQRVGSRVSAAAAKFASEYKIPMSSSPPTYTVVRSDTPNAFVLPNNHIFVLTGLFQYAKDEDELAAVLSHEMAHNLARHAGEKVSSTILIQIMARVLLMIDPSGVLFYLFLPAASLLHELPHSRETEIEADHIGVYLASEACFDPRAAVRVFR
jgi:predicted Zn-dependent protease